MSLAEYRVEADRRRAQAKAKARTLADLKREVGDSGYTPEELAEIQPDLKAACAARNPDWGITL